MSFNHFYDSNFENFQEHLQVITSDMNPGRDNNDPDSLDHQLPNDYTTTSSNVHYMPVTLPSPTFDLMHHQTHLFAKKSDVNHHHSSMQIYGDAAAFSNLSNAQLVQSSLPVLTPLNLNLKYVEFQSAGGASSGSDSESLNEHNRTRAKRNLPHKKRLKKLNHEQHQFTPISMQEDESNIRVVQANQPQFECTECSALIAGQLEFFMHLKEHYEPSEGYNVVKVTMQKEEGELKL